jgi:hypothetical protein
VAVLAELIESSVGLHLRALTAELGTDCPGPPDHETGTALTYALRKGTGTPSGTPVHQHRPGHPQPRRHHTPRARLPHPTPFRPRKTDTDHRGAAQPSKDQKCRSHDSGTGRGVSLSRPNGLTRD